MERPRDGAEILAENVLARIAYEASRRGLLRAEPTGKPAPEAPGPRPLCGSERAFRKRRKELLQQARELEASDRTA